MCATFETPAHGLDSVRVTPTATFPQLEHVAVARTRATVLVDRVPSRPMERSSELEHPKLVDVGEVAAVAGRAEHPQRPGRVRCQRRHAVIMVASTVTAHGFGKPGQRPATTGTFAGGCARAPVA
jgi:hypothetical protein